MKYTVEMGSRATICIPAIQNFMGVGDTQTQ
jgi:hypothetical protein